MDGKICFLILHYMAAQTTMDCVDSIIQNIDTDNFCIVIVDNASANQSGRQLKEFYSDNKKISVLLNDDNLGFARGNNVGFRYAKDIEKCRFICMLNNDTLLEQKDFTECIFKIYKQNNCAVIGPQIILKDNGINPVMPPLGSIKDYKKELFFNRMSVIKTYLGIDDIYFTKIFRKSDGKKNYGNANTNHKDIVLHGCCLIFTPIYLKKFSGIDDRTFMFREEEFLYLRLMQNNMSDIYSTEIQIRHLEDVATDMFLKKPRKKKLFLYKNQIASLKMLIEELKNLSIYRKL